MCCAGKFRLVANLTTRALPPWEGATRLRLRSMSPQTTSAHEQRRLAAIVFTDVAGYSARMQRDETGTLALVRADFGSMKESCTQHGGEVLKSTGDGLLMSFGSVVQAVTCAMQIQKEFGARPPEALQHRIGIHLGDVFREGGDVVGDGVNIAARLQTKARPGTICVSQSVYEAVKGKLPLQAEALGPQSFKNIAEPLNVLLIHPEGAPMPAASLGRWFRGRWLAAEITLVFILLLIAGWRELRRPSPSPALPGAAIPSALPALSAANGLPAPTDEPQVDPKSIAVLPFTNMSEDKDNAYFADGVHEDLLTQLALIGDLKVTSRTSVAEYRGTAKKVRQIGAELKVGNLLEGSVRRVGNKVRVTAQLIRAATDEHLWAKSYDRDLNDVFAIQAELATEIAQSLQATLSPKLRTELARVPTQNMAAYELLLRQQDASRRSVNQPDLDALIGLLTQAVQLDPGFAIAWARLGTTQARKIFDFEDVSPERLAQAQAAINRALELAPDAPEIRLELGNFYYYALRDYARAKAIYGEILALAPHNVEVLAQMGYVLRREGRFRESNEAFEKVLALDPRHMRVLGNMFYNFLRIRDYPGAVATARRMVALQPGTLSHQYMLHRALWLQTGSFSAYEAWREQQPLEVQAKNPGIAIIDFNRALAHGDFDAAERLLGRLRGTARATSEDALFWWATGDTAAARQSAELSLADSRKILSKQPDQPKELADVALLEALLGEKDAAWRDYRRAEELISANRDAFVGVDVAAYKARILAVLGQREAVMAELRKPIQVAPILSVEFAPATDLAFAAMWKDPEFQAIVSDPAYHAPLQ